MKVRDIALAAVLTALVIVVKYALGFIPGVEVVTMMIVIISILLPLKISLITTISFIGAVGLIYGIGSWWVVYWIMYPSMNIISWSAKKFVAKNNITYAIWCFIWGLSIFIWYIPHDYIVFGKAYMQAQIFGSVIANLIGGATNFVLALLLFYPFKKGVENYDRLGNNSWK